MEKRKIFADSVVRPEDQGYSISPEDAPLDHEMTIVFDLADPIAEAELERLVAGGKRLSPAELGSYGVPEKEASRLVDWLMKQGLEVVRRSSDHRTVEVRGTVRQLRSALRVDIRCVQRNGRTYVAAVGPPSLPTSVSSLVQSIGGLQPFPRGPRKN